MIKAIDKDTRIVSLVPFPVHDFYNKYKAGTLSHPFCEGALTEVKVVSRVAENYTLLEGVSLVGDEKPIIDQVTPESLRNILAFTFRDTTNTYTHTEEMWDKSPDADEKKSENQLNIYNRIIGQIMNAFVGDQRAYELLGAEGLKAVNPAALESYSNYFNAIAHQFNTGNGGQPVFKKEGKFVKVRFKLVRQGQGKSANNLKLSLNGNCIERVSELTSANSTLSVYTSGKNPDRFELIEAPKPRLGIAVTNPPIGGGSNSNNGWPEDV